MELMKGSGSESNLFSVSEGEEFMKFITGNLASYE